MDEGSRLVCDIAQTFYSAFEDLLASEIEFATAEGELNLESAGLRAAEAAEVIRFSVVGLKNGAGSADGFQRRVEQFVRVYFNGLAT